MKSKSSTLILILAAVLVVGILVYFFVIRSSGSSSASTDAGLVSTNTGAASAVPTAATSAGNPGDQVVALLRNLTAISLSDAVFQNPSFAMLTDLSIALPPATNPGRRNPFAPVGTDASTSTVTTTTSTAPSSSSTTTTPPATRASMGGPAGF